MSPLTFAIGDVHGCLDMLQGLLGACEAHAAGRPARYVFLGDYIDRGPDSRGVIQLLMRRQQAQPGTHVCLRGNHEQMAIMAHESALALPLWLQNAARPPSPIIRARMAESRTPISVWTLADDCHTDCTPTHGYEPTREAAMAAFAKSWRRRKAVMEE